ncbi:MAG TPA: XdhC/CoxI family protein, partial [Alphaproteobacteria bacterium]|nr:XdhC/CoxI family protein [Alphaproteobacteria bacterium]
ADLRIICVGAVHIAQHLEELARILGHDMVVVDPREAFVTKQRFPNSQHVVGWPDEVMKDGFIDRHSAVVSLTHDEKIDDPGLMAALKSDAFYVGALGSTRTHAKRVA